MLCFPAKKLHESFSSFTFNFVSKLYHSDHTNFIKLKISKKQKAQKMKFLKFSTYIFIILLVVLPNDAQDVETLKVGLRYHKNSRLMIFPLKFRIDFVDISRQNKLNREVSMLSLDLVHPLPNCQMASKSREKIAMEDKECPDFRLGTVDKKLLALR
jgi:hypothetical protein